MLYADDILLIAPSVCEVNKLLGSTENAGPENGGPKKDERTENVGLKMKDQMSRVENAGPENAGPNVMGGKCRT